MKLTKALKGLPEDLRIEISENEMRKDFTESEKARIQDILREHLVRGGGEKHEHGANEAIGEILGESHENVRRRDRVFEKADEKMKKDLDTGKKSLGAAYKEVAKKKPATPPKIPDGKFAHIVQDPAWNRGTVADIARLKIRDVAAANCILYLWAPVGRLIDGTVALGEYTEMMGGKKCESELAVQSDALTVMRCQGFTPKKIIPCVLGGVVNYLVIGTRGTVPRLETGDNVIATGDAGAGWALIEGCAGAAGIGDSKRHKLVLDGLRDGWTGRGEGMK